MKIAIASDHAGYRYKELVKRYLISKGLEVSDFGTDTEAPCDYPDFVIPAAKALRDGHVERAILLGGSGNGEAIAANRIQGVRCCLCLTVELAKLARMHNDSNAISLGQRIIRQDQLIEIVEAWLGTPFEGGRHIPRIEKIESLSQHSITD
ncbi:ribose 5-phosphate isomerase B [Pseudomonas aeruginosa]|jgi:ribose 5-phosphate isomerase B|uniref:ribose 5-phosphate isomerase B n=1 Tax=Pseudomonas aeruginosa TaxID=287 RepID=UPI0018D32EEC|nr:ribose 5-phosphate isomerase B [Pseudomonas aeruginosa]MBH1722707.1 ribose 5-phosphate isomerase B [Stenotrophomonas maltophilia]EIY2610312.1 ribose 5-phosphate isomerase B [Pseudomonas aeruginosa]EIY2743120.1 ribose 5-phosphate isomerase B [Pseudomonas aeruginosa]EKM0200875.1 ribose 5-phosphate isomerase B [Pseudomonas aeruginosa]EKM0220476.1 ribose 5-phosphate isomerase B [Pseudomonas aeruginosa]